MTLLKIDNQFSHMTCLVVALDSRKHNTSQDRDWDQERSRPNKTRFTNKNDKNIKIHMHNTTHKLKPTMDLNTINTMRTITIVSSLIAFAIADGKTFRVFRRAKRQSAGLGIRGAVIRCYPMFNEFEECMTNTTDCSRERRDYFNCLCEDCDLSFTENPAESTIETHAVITSKSNATSSSFGTALFAQLCHASPETNVLISPLSGTLY